MKTFFRWFLVIAILFSAPWAGASPGVFFEGPKITDLKGPNTPIFMPENFAVYSFIDGAQNDAAVPDDMREILGMENLDQWTSASPNSYFNVHPLSEVGNHILQVAEADFNGSGASDLLVINTGFFRLCYDYTGTACGSSSNNYEIQATDGSGKVHNIIPFAGAVADFNGDGKDDVAVIGHTSDTFQGYLTVYLNNGSNAATPFDEPAYFQAEIPQGAPLSIAVGDYKQDGKADIAVASMPTKPNLGAFGSTFTNTGAGFTQADHTYEFTMNECYSPTGLVSYDGDGDSADDLVLTCYQGFVCPPLSINCSPTPVSGPVVTLKNNGDGSTFSKQQTIQDLKFPYSSSLGDFNLDGKIDIAVASNGGQAVLVFTGNAPFQVDVPGKSFSTAPYPPKFIQTQMMNNDALPDLILTANQPDLPAYQQGEGLEVATPDMGRGNLLVSRDSGLIGKVLYGQDLSLARASINRADLLDKKFERTDAKHLKFKYTPNRIGRQYSRATYFSEANPDANKLMYFQEISSINELPASAVVLPTHGVLVLINSRPEVSIDEPSCDQKTINYRCMASTNVMVESCTATTSDANVTVAQAQPSGAAAEKTGTITVPALDKSYTFTVTAVDSAGNTVTGDFTVDFTQCPSPGLNLCPAEPIEKVLVVTKPYMICPFENDPALSSSLAGKSVTWSQSSGEDLFTGKGAVIEPATIQDGCITGRVGTHFSQEGGQSVYELKYSVENGPQDCPARLVIPNVSLEGGPGRFCSLDKQAQNSNSLVWLPLFLSAVILAAWRRRSES